MLFQISRTLGGAYLASLGIASLVYFITAGVLCGASGRRIQLRSPLFTGLILALLLASIGWILLAVLAMGAEALLPKTFDPPKWLLWTIALLPSLCSGLIASGIPYSHFRSDGKGKEGDS